jgi:hypothetical protein
VCTILPQRQHGAGKVSTNHASIEKDGQITTKTLPDLARNGSRTIKER